MAFSSERKGNYYWIYLYRLLLVMALFFICRILFYLLNTTLFAGIHVGEWTRILKGGFVFDTAALFYFNGLFILLMLLPFRLREAIWYQRIVMYIFFVSNGVAMLLNCIDFIYYRFTLRRTTRTVFSEFSHEVNKSALFKNFIVDYWYVAVIFIALIVLMIWAYKKVKIKPAAVRSKNRVFYTKAISVLLISIALAIGGIRGDFKYSTRPITISNAGEYVNTPNEVYLVLNTPFCMVRTWNVKGLEEVKFFSDDEVEKIYSPVHYPKQDSLPFTKKNVVVIILESFGKEAVGGYNRDLDDSTYTGFTPFLVACRSLVPAGHRLADRGTRHPVRAPQHRRPRCSGAGGGRRAGPRRGAGGGGGGGRNPRCGPNLCDNDGGRAADDTRRSTR